LPKIKINNKKGTKGTKRRDKKIKNKLRYYFVTTMSPTSPSFFS